MTNDIHTATKRTHSETKGGKENVDNVQGVDPRAAKVQKTEVKRSSIWGTEVSTCDKPRNNLALSILENNKNKIQAFLKKVVNFHRNEFAKKEDELEQLEKQGNSHEIRSSNNPVQCSGHVVIDKNTSIPQKIDLTKINIKFNLPKYIILADKEKQAKLTSEFVKQAIVQALPEKCDKSFGISSSIIANQKRIEKLHEELSFPQTNNPFLLAIQSLLLKQESYYECILRGDYSEEDKIQMCHLLFSLVYEDSMIRGNLFTHVNNNSDSYSDEILWDFITQSLPTLDFREQCLFLKALETFIKVMQEDDFLSVRLASDENGETFDTLRVFYNNIHDSVKKLLKDAGNIKENGILQTFIDLEENNILNEIKMHLGMHNNSHLTLEHFGWLGILDKLDPQIKEKLLCIETFRITRSNSICIEDMDQFFGIFQIQESENTLQELSEDEVMQFSQKALSYFDSKIDDISNHEASLDELYPLMSIALRLLSREYDDNTIVENLEMLQDFILPHFQESKNELIEQLPHEKGKNTLSAETLEAFKNNLIKCEYESSDELMTLALTYLYCLEQKSEHTETLKSKLLAVILDERNAEYNWCKVDEDDDVYKFKQLAALLDALIPVWEKQHAQEEA